MSQQLNIIPYDWKAEDINGKTEILIWSWNQNREAHLLRILDFYPTAYLELPKGYIDFETLRTKLSTEVGMVKTKLVQKFKLYYYTTEKTNFIKLYFNSLTNLKKFENFIKRTGSYQGISVVLREADVGLVRKLLTYKNLKYSDPFGCMGTLVPETERISKIKEYMIDFESMVPRNQVFNIMPSVLTFRLKVSDSGAVERVSVLTDTGKTYQVEQKSEKDTIQGFFDLITNLDPDLIVGYEIYTRAFPYLQKRLGALGMSFGNLGRLKNGQSAIKHLYWSSSAYGHNSLSVLEIDGRLTIDMQNFIKRTVKLDKYDFVSVAKHFDLQFENSLESANLVTLELYNKLDTWIESVELSSIVGVGISELFTRGEQIRSFSLIYDFAHRMNFIVDYIEQPEIQVEGGKIYASDSGIYNNTLWFDFASEYPSIIISHNIDYTTLVKNEEVKDSDVLTVLATNNGGVFSERFVKKDIRVGVLPTLLSELMAERNATKKLIAETGNIRYVKREKLLKVSINAITGFLGISHEMGGILSLIPAFMSVTALGRQLTETANEYLTENFSAIIRYNDTDSIALTLSEEHKISELYEIGEEMSKEVTNLFPEPITLKFDGVYKFILLTAKKYAILKINKDGSFGCESVKKGLLSIRSDTNKFTANIFAKVLDNILYSKSVIETINGILDEIEKLLEEKVNIEDLAQVKKINTKYAPTSTYFLNTFIKRMQMLGIKIDLGTEVSYVVLEKLGEKKIGEKMMLLELVKSSDKYNVNYYVDALINQLDQLLIIGYKDKLNSDVSYKPPKSRKKAVSLVEPMKIISLQVESGGSLEELRKWFMYNLR